MSEKIMSPKMAGSFDCRKYNQKLPKEQWPILADTDTIIFTATFPINDVPATFMRDGNIDGLASRLYISRGEREAAAAERRQEHVDRVAFKFKIGSSCRWFNGRGEAIERPTNGLIDGKHADVMIQFARKEKSPNDALAPSGYWANAIMFKLSENKPFAGMEFDNPDEADVADGSQFAEQEVPKQESATDNPEIKLPF